MIKVQIKRNNKYITQIKIKGHAQFGEYGKDLVCAGVSAVATGICNTLSKKGVGSTKNGRDSKSKRLGAKLSDGQFATAGSIIYRQRGTKIHPGTNVGKGGDDTLFAMCDGIVKFERMGKDRKKVSVYPAA